MKRFLVVPEAVEGSGHLVWEADEHDARIIARCPDLDDAYRIAHAMRKADADGLGAFERWLARNGVAL